MTACRRQLLDGSIRGAAVQVGLCWSSRSSVICWPVRCPSDLELLVQRAGAIWEPGCKRWLVERRRIGPLVRVLRRETDPLFRHAGLRLDEAP